MTQVERTTSEVVVLLNNFTVSISLLAFVLNWIIVCLSQEESTVGGDS